jgi:hypothetical protein
VITHYCRIVNSSIFLDGIEVFCGHGIPTTKFFEKAYEEFGIDYPKFYKMDNLSKAGFLAAELLMKDKQIRNLYADDEISIVLANSNASLDTDTRYQSTAKAIASPALFVYTLPNIVAGEICIRHKIKGENAFFVSAEFDADLMQSYVSMLNRHHLCLAGWVDVMEEHHDVFLYLLDKTDTGLPHAASILKELYKKEYGTVNG